MSSNEMPLVSRHAVHTRKNPAMHTPPVNAEGACRSHSGLQQRKRISQKERCDP